MFDTHCHLQFNAYKEDSEEVYRKCQEKGVILNVVGSQIDTSIRAVEFAEKHENTYATIGLHPVHLHETTVDEGEVTFKSREEDFDYEKYKELAKSPKVIAIGECGLELFHLPDGLDKEKILEKQKEAFLLQCKLAQELGLPMVIHVRNAYSEILDIFQSPILSLKSSIRGVIHCYTGNWELSKKFLDLGFYLGFTNIVTFPPKKTNPKPQLDLLEVVKNCPLDRMLIETDSPYLAPQKYRGERCEPWMVEEALQKIAEIRGINPAELEKITDQNAKRLFTKIK